MSTKTLTKADAIKAYATADPSVKKFLTGLWGEETFVPNPPRFPKTVEEAYRGLKLTRVKEIPFPKPKNIRQEVANALFDLNIVGEYMQNGCVFDWRPNNNQRKYFGVFNMNLAGFGFSYTLTASVGTGTGVGSRLYFLEDAQAVHFNSHPAFLPLHKLVLTNQK